MRYQQYLLTTVAWLAIATNFAIADEEFSLVIDPFTGAASLRNDTASPIELDSYFIASPSDPVLQVDAWGSLEDNSVAGWRESSSDSGNRLAELNLTGSLEILGNESVSIGNPYPAFSPSTLGERAPALNSLRFNYTLANESVQRRGDVEFSARNTLVLVVDPNTGESKIENQSSFNIDLDSYLVKSIPSVLSTESWSPLSGSDDAWRSSTGTSNRIAEGNLFGSTSIGASQSLALGTPIDPSILDDESDLELVFTTTDFDAPIAGGILFRSAGTLDPLDCNGDGTVNILDANCTSQGDLDGFLAGLSPASLRGDTDGNGTVEFADFLVLSGRFGQAGGFTDGDFDGSGTVDFADFLTLSSAFGQGAQGSLSAVPEPSTGGWIPAVLVAVACLRRRAS